MRKVGVTVLPEFFQNEGIEGVLDNLQQRADVTAIATSPYVMAPAADGSGSREPPIDGGAGKVRVLDRLLWGRRELWVRTAPSFAPDLRRYAGLRYRPAEPDDLTRAEGATVGRVIAACKARGLQVHLQVQAALPPGYRVQFGGPVEEDRPRLPNGSSPLMRVDNNGSLASPHILAYTQALLGDLAAAYPEVDAIRIDWPEYPPYSLKSLFFDFSPHACAAMAAHGVDPELARRGAAALWNRLATLRPEDLPASPEGLGFSPLREICARTPGVDDWLRAKRAIVTAFVRGCAAALREASGGGIALIPQAFPPPWTRLSGFDYRSMADAGAAALLVKLFTMHWPMMLRAYGETIAARNPALGRDPRLAPMLAAILGIADDPASVGPLADIHYPEPEEPHPASARVQAEKIRTAQAEAGRIHVWPSAHGYGPVADFRNRAATAFEAANGRLWVNRYGYLSDAKLDALGEVTAPVTSEAR